MPIFLRLNPRIFFRSNLANSNENPVKIYNAISGNTAPISWGEVFRMANEHLYETPLEGMIWYPTGTVTKSFVLNRILDLMLHQLPAYTTDLICRLLGKKPFAVGLCSRMQSGMRSLEYFTTNQWSWDSDNVDELARIMDPKDRNAFYFLLEDFCWDDFMRRYVEASKSYSS